MPNPSQRRHGRGQSFTELAIFMPVLIILLAGMTEVVFLFDHYLQMLDAVRNGARDSADSDPFPAPAFSNAPSAYDTRKVCAETGNFFRLTGCNTNNGLAYLKLTLPTSYSPSNDGGYGTLPNPLPSGMGNQARPANCSSHPNTPWQNDTVISIFSISVSGSAGSRTFNIKRFDNNQINSGVGELVEDTDESGWSFMQDQYSTGGMCSAMSNARLLTEINKGNAENTPNTAFLLVETFYNHYQIFDAVNFGEIIPNPIKVHSYAIFPLVAAEATPTIPSP